MIEDIFTRAFDLLRSAPASILAVTQELGTGNMIVLFGMIASLITPLVLTARRMDRR